VKSTVKVKHASMSDAPTGARDATQTAAELGGVLELTVPHGVAAGDALAVLREGQPRETRFEIVVPPGARPGDTVRVEPPQHVVAAVPPGVAPGGVFYVQTDRGVYEILCPEGVAAGDDIEVTIPSLAVLGAARDGRSDAAASAVEGPLDERSERGTRDADACTLAPASSGTGGSAPAAAWAVGRRVRVMRSNGSWSAAVVAAYDDLSGTYTVRLEPSGALKHLVEEGELAEPSFEPPRAGEHYEGRQVQVRSRMEHALWEAACVRGFDSATRTYTLELCGGGAAPGQVGDLRHGVRPDEIRLRQRV
jgi:hypothetical protein